MTFSELQAQIQAWIEDDGVEFAGSIPDVIFLAETLVQRDLDLGIFASVASRVATVGNPLILRPGINDTIAFQHVYTDIAGVRYWIQHRSVDFVTDFLSDTTNGIPKFYAEYDETQWIMAPRPAVAYTISGRALVRATRLSDTHTATWLGNNVPTLLFKACLHEAEGFVKDDQRTEMWKKQYTDMLPLVKRDLLSLVAERYSLTPMETPAQPTLAR